MSMNQDVFDQISHAYERIAAEVQRRGLTLDPRTGHLVRET